MYNIIIIFFILIALYLYECKKESFTIDKKTIPFWETIFTAVSPNSALYSGIKSIG